MEKKLSKNKQRQLKRYGGNKKVKVFKGEIGADMSPSVSGRSVKKIGKAKRKAISKIITSMSGNTITRKVKRVRK